MFRTVLAALALCLASPAAQAVPLYADLSTFNDGQCGFGRYGVFTRPFGPCFMDRSDNHYSGSGPFDYVHPAFDPFLIVNIGNAIVLSETNKFARMVFTNNVVRNGPGADLLIWTNTPTNVRLALFPGDVPILGTPDGFLNEGDPGFPLSSFGLFGDVWFQFSYDLSDLGMARGEYVDHLWVDAVEDGLTGQRVLTNISQSAALLPTVPVPASLPLLGGALVLIAGFSLRRKRR